MPHGHGRIQPIRHQHQTIDVHSYSKRPLDTGLMALAPDPPVKSVQVREWDHFISYNQSINQNSCHSLILISNIARAMHRTYGSTLSFYPTRIINLKHSLSIPIYDYQTSYNFTCFCTESDTPCHAGMHDVMSVSEF